MPFLLAGSLQACQQGRVGWQAQAKVQPQARQERALTDHSNGTVTVIRFTDLISLIDSPLPLALSQINVFSPCKSPLLSLRLYLLSLSLISLIYYLPFLGR